MAKNNAGWMGWVLVLATLSAPVPAEEPPAGAPVELQPMSAPIVNGALTGEHPSVGMLISGSGQGFCSGTLLGCRTMLTAAHCVCAGSTAATCNPAPASSIAVWLPHAGLVPVASVHVNPRYDFAAEGDFAILKLGQDVLGAAPSILNTVARPPKGSAGVLVGFGTWGGSHQQTGVKRVGQVATAGCSAVPDSKHVCWSFAAPLGPAGQDSNTCGGDSGGPLFVDLGGDQVLAGVTSGGLADDCLAPDQSFNADAYTERSWIAAIAGADLGTAGCGDLAPAGSPASPSVWSAGVLSSSQPAAQLVLAVPPNTERLVVTLNAEDSVDFDLTLEAPGSAGTMLCSSASPAALESCIVESPAAGSYPVTVERFSGSGTFQVVATSFAAASAGTGGTCQDDLDGGRVCLLDGRFEVVMTWTGFPPASATQPVVFTRQSPQVAFGTFQNDPENITLVAKVTKGCSFNGHYWFWLGGFTRAGWDVTVTDTVSGISRSYPKAVGGDLPKTLQDIGSFPCS